MKLPKEKCEELPYASVGEIVDGFEVISKNICDTSRWSIVYAMVVKYEDKLYETSYSVGATEQQDEQPWEYNDEVEFVEVRPVEKTITTYERITE